MIELQTGSSLINGLGFNATCNDNLIPSLCRAIMDLHVGNPVSLSTDFWINDNVNLYQHGIKDSKGYMRLQIEDTVYEYLVLEFPRLVDSKEKFSMLGEHIKEYVPEVYKAQVGCALTSAAIGSLFTYRGLLLFCFIDDKLQQISTLPTTGYRYNNDASTIEEYINQLSLLECNMSKDEVRNLNDLFKSDIAVTLNGNPNRGYYTTYQNTFELTLFVRKHYLRLNGLQISGPGDFSLLLNRRSAEGTYKNNEQLVNLITAVIMPNAPVSTHFSKPYFGQQLLKMNGGIGPATTHLVFPLVVDKYPNVSGYIMIKLSKDDADFLKQVNAVTSDSVYSKHKVFVVAPDASVTRGCKAITNASGSIRVLIREDKKKASDDEAYKNRVFRDYLSHAISLVCIPMFQKEFVIPEYLQKSFEFNMATLTSTYYLPHKQYGKSRHTDRYEEVFQQYGQNGRPSSCHF